MKFSTRTRYGLRFLVYLAMHREGPDFIQLKQVAEEESISMKYLEQIVRLLKRSGLLAVSRGAYGGYALARAPENITMKEVFISLEGSLSPVGCLDGKLTCAKFGHCETFEVWHGLENAMSDYLVKISLKSLVDEYLQKNKKKVEVVTATPAMERSAINV
jgi:Rrf2 family protein